MRSSPLNGASILPLKKYVTCAYFSVSAVRSMVIPALDTISATMFAIEIGGEGNGARDGSADILIVATGALRRARPSKPLDFGSVRGRAVCPHRARPELKEKP